MIEKSPESEFSENELALISKLRENGIDDPQSKELLLAWCAAEEARVAELNTSRAGIELDLKKAKLYRAAGFQTEAWASLEAARVAAHNENDENLFEQAEALMNEMGRE